MQISMQGRISIRAEISIKVRYVAIGSITDCGPNPVILMVLEGLQPSGVDYIQCFIATPCISVSSYIDST